MSPALRLPQDPASRLAAGRLAERRRPRRPGRAPPGAGQAPGSLRAGPCCRCRPRSGTHQDQAAPSTSKRSSRNPGRAGEERSDEVGTGAGGRHAVPHRPGPPVQRSLLRIIADTPSPVRGARVSGTARVCRPPVVYRVGRGASLATGPRRTRRESAPSRSQSKRWVPSARLGQAILLLCGSPSGSAQARRIQVSAASTLGHWSSGSARAVGGNATKAALSALAAALGVPRGAVTLVAGASSRTKIVDITGADPAVVSRLLAGPGRTG